MTSIRTVNHTSPADARARDGVFRAAVRLGLWATLIGIGLGRFAYSPLLPSMIDAGWLGPGEAAQAGAANLVGYLLGAALAVLFPRVGGDRGLRLALVATVLSLLACAVPLGASWVWGWRALAGVGGAWLMIRGVSRALLAVPVVDRARAGGMAFTGIGLGTLLTALGGALADVGGAALGWLLAAAAGAIGLWGAHTGLERLPPGASLRSGVEAAERRAAPWSPAMLVLAYALIAVAVVPHAVFWVEFLVRERGQSLAAASLQWWCVGLGSLIGPLCAGHLARHGRSRVVLAGAMAATALALWAAAVSTRVTAWVLVSLAIGALVPAIVSLTSIVLAEQVGSGGHARWWAAATLSFAGGQALSGLLASAHVDAGGGYAGLFSAGAAVAAAATALFGAIAGAWRSPRLPADSAS